MSPQKTIFAALIFIGSLALAHADAPCDICGKMDQLEQAPDTAKANTVANLLGHFTFSKDSHLWPAEATAVTRLSAKYATDAVDPEGDIGNFYYDIYRQKPGVMKKALSGLSTTDLNTLEVAYCLNLNMEISGNGSLPLGSGVSQTGKSCKTVLKKQLNKDKASDKSDGDDGDGAALSPCATSPDCRTISNRTNQAKNLRKVAVQGMNLGKDTAPPVPPSDKDDSGQ